MLQKIVKMFVPDKSQKDLAEVKPLVEQINAEFAKLSSISDDALRGKTADFKARIARHLEPIKQEIAKVDAQVKAMREAGDVAELEEVFRGRDKLVERRNTELESVLEQILPEAFAVVKETARRLATNKQLVVTANELDERAVNRLKSENAKVMNVEIADGKATWKNQWIAADSLVEWNMVHYDVQLIGGITLHKGRIAEMATGEGKTLVATLPAYLNGIAGYGVHIVTVNNYLAKRDMEWNRPIFEFHGLTVDCVDLHQPNSDDRRAAYQADITYGTNNEFGFDYLRDNMAGHLEHLVQRPHHYAIIDEIDSVLIDEARTPLIISGPVPRGDVHEYNELKPRIERLVNKQRQLIQDEIKEARRLFDKGEPKEAAVHLFRAYRGLPKYNPLIKMLSEEGKKVAMQKAEAVYLADNQKRMPEIDDELYFTIDEKNNQIEMTDKGRDLITQQGEDENLFVMPDVASILSALSADESMTDEEKTKKRQEIAADFSEKSERLHSISQLLKAYTLFEKDVEYIVDEGKVNIVDENTGRVMPGRRYSDGLHQAIEAKENVKVEAATQTYATVTLQNYFRMYHKLSGMTGTAETEAEEFYKIYELDVVVIPTNKPIIRIDEDDRVYKTKREKFNAIIEMIKELTEAGRPVLVGTTSVEISEQLSRFLRMAKIKHNILNAKNHAREAEIVAEAGQAPGGVGNVTIATNMAGRGTDIKLGEGVREAGGLAIIGSERHDSRRIDLQLRGRAGRQGDPGSSHFFVSLEDDLMRLFSSQRVAKMMDFLKVPEGEMIQHKRITKTIAGAQRKVEENNFSTRKHLLEYDDIMNKQREVIYKRRNNALHGDRMRVDIDNAIIDMCHILGQSFAGTEDAEQFQMEVARVFALPIEIDETQLTEFTADGLANHLYELASQQYGAKVKFLKEQVYADLQQMAQQQLAASKNDQEFADNFLNRYLEVEMSDGGSGRVKFFVVIGEVLETEGRAFVQEFEKSIILGVIDNRWKEHLRAMDELKQNVQTARFEQKDPLMIYKREAF
ncbi:MAG: preprotein translocase subunit SecA, partial [Bacteroidota bacterium]